MILILGRISQFPPSGAQTMSKKFATHPDQTPGDKYVNDFLPLWGGRRCYTGLSLLHQSEWCYNFTLIRFGFSELHTSFFSWSFYQTIFVFVLLFVFVCICICFVFVVVTASHCGMCRCLSRLKIRFIKLQNKVNPIITQNNSTEIFSE